MDIGVRVEGDIETNRLSVSIDRDVLNVVSHKGSTHTVLAFRLKEDFSREEEDSKESEEVTGILKGSRIHSFKKRTLPVFDSDDDSEGNETTSRRETKRKRKKREGRGERVRSKRRRSRKESSASESEDTDEWIP